VKTGEKGTFVTELVQRVFVVVRQCVDLAADP
jgi:hypothetical protein